MPLTVATLRELACADGAVPQAVVESTEPIVLRGLVAHWPAVREGRRSVEAGTAYLKGFYRDATVGAWFGPPEIRGRFFYNDDLSGFNYRAAMVKLQGVLEAIESHQHEALPPAVYVGSTSVDTCLPGFRAHNDVVLPAPDPLASIWIGNRTRVAAHYDVPDNVACVVMGRRRFTVLPPSQLPNLYVGPLDFTPAGQPISLVDFAAPDLERFPRFARALESARTAALEPGDAIFVPSMWWHHVEALDALNVLVNYWWRKSPAYMGSPSDVLMHALLSLRGLPAAERETWRAMFSHYVFDADEETLAHLPPGRRGAAGAIDENRARELRARLLNRLNR